MLASRSVLAACLTLCLQREAQALVVVVRPEDLPSEELPVDRFDRLVVKAPDSSARPHANRRALARLSKSAQTTAEPALLT